MTGYPLSHTLSPAIHAAALQACGLKGDYSLYPIHMQDLDGLRDLISSVRSGSLDGLNVTIPHKQTVVEFLDVLTPVAKAVGAVNTIYLDGDRLVGDNTDADGFIEDLDRFLGEENRSTGHSALVIGAGGSARAVVYALLTAGWDVAVTSRRIEQTQDLAKVFSLDSVMAVEWFQFEPTKFQLIVNTTPLGMLPDVAQSPWPEEVAYPPDAVVYDLVYNPRITKLVRDAEAHGLAATTGIGMLIEQGALAFEKWTGCRPPRDVLWEAVNQPLKDQPG